MTAPARDFLNAFDALAPGDQRQVAAEILRRSMGVGELPGGGLEQLADEVFQSYDTEEEQAGAKD